MSDTAIKFEHVSKLYRLGVVGTGTISHDLRRWWITSVRGKEDPYLKIGETNDRSSKGISDYVYALQDIDFEVKQGDVLGIIGKNGAGKSTLLKLLSRVTYPTTGKIYTKGRIASLLEVGTGFHPELTGRENIYMNGSILGMKKWEIDKQLDAIVDFSGCERYIDTPVKRYSSGMTVRLGFAIAAHLNPEILVVDEVLAVGDAEFQKKAIGKMQDVSKGEGRTVLFVSHNMGSIKSLCNKGIVLENGKLSHLGNVYDCVDYYISNLVEHSLKSSSIITDDNRPFQHFNRKIELQEVYLKNSDSNMLAYDEDIMLEIVCKMNRFDIKWFQLCCVIVDSNGNKICHYVSKPINTLYNNTTFKIHVRLFDLKLPKGHYHINLELAQRDFSNCGNNITFDAANEVIAFNVLYIHKDKKDEFLNWNSSWAMRLDLENGIEISKIE